jgi:hypothetical protein
MKLQGGGVKEWTRGMTVTQMLVQRTEWFVIFYSAVVDKRGVRRTGI